MHYFYIKIFTTLVSVREYKALVKIFLLRFANFFIFMKSFERLIIIKEDFRNDGENTKKILKEYYRVNLEKLYEISHSENSPIFLSKSRNL